MELIIIFILHTLSYLFLGWTFALVERNEDLWTQDARDRNKLWHKTKFIALFLLITGESYGMYGLSLLTLIFLATQGFLAMFVFNISINLFKKNKWYHLGNNPIDSLGHKNPILFFVINFIIAISGIVTLCIIS